MRFYVTLGTPGRHRLRYSCIRKAIEFTYVQYRADKMSWWGKKGPDKPSVESHDAASKSSRPVAGHDANQPERSKLPPKLQKMVDKSDKEDNFFDELVDG